MAGGEIHDGVVTRDTSRAVAARPFHTASGNLAREGGQVPAVMTSDLGKRHGGRCSPPRQPPATARASLDDNDTVRPAGPARQRRILADPAVARSKAGSCPDIGSHAPRVLVT